TWAASGIDTSDASDGVSHTASLAATMGAHSTIAATAVTESANPYECARYGSTHTSTTTPAAKAGNAWAGLPHHNAAHTAIAIARARSTDGSGKTSAANPAITSA